VLAAPAAYDAKHRIFWEEFATRNGTQINFYGMDVDTGKVTFQLANTYNMETMDYDPVTGTTRHMNAVKALKGSCLELDCRCFLMGLM